MGEQPKEKITKIPNFDWDKAKSFYYVAKVGSVTEGAKFLNITQSALSRQMMILEDSLSFKLFIRTPKGISLTRKGEELLSIVEKAFLDLKGFTYTQKAMVHNGQKRKIRIAATHADAAYIINELILDYNQDHPHLVFEIIADDRFLDLMFNDVDIAISPFDPQAKNVQQEFLFSLQKKLYASREYLQKYGEPQTVEDLKEHRFLAFGYPGGILPYALVNWSLTLGMPKGKLREPVYTSNSLECLIEAAERGIGIYASYERMSILRKAQLVNVLPNIVYEEAPAYLIYPDYLVKDAEIIRTKKYLQEKLD